MNILQKILPVIMACLVAATAVAIPITPLETTTGGFVGMANQGPLDQPTLVTGYAEFVSIFGATTSGLENPYLAPSVAGYFANGGVNLVVVRVASADDAVMIGFDGGWTGSRTGLQTLIDVDEVSFVAIPGVGSAAVQQAMIAHCEAAGDRMAILDSESPDDFEAVQVQRAGLSTANGYAALYYPWVQAAPAGESLLLPPSGFVAGFFSAKDTPNSPVGVIATATDLAFVMTSEDQDILNAQNINALRSLAGIRIWGARTLASNQEYNYVGVRRLGMFIGESVQEGTQWCLDEPNEAYIWTQLRADVGVFMNDLFRDGWLQGSTTEAAFFVQCGLGSTMTQLDMDEGRTIINVGYAALSPAEYLIEIIEHERVDLSAAPHVEQSVLTFSPAVPNPFNPSTEISLNMPRRGKVSVAIFDTRGARVRELHDGMMEEGRHTLRWNGMSTDGRAMPSGIYLVRAVGSDAEVTAKLVLAR